MGNPKVPTKLLSACNQERESVKDDSGMRIYPTDTNYADGIQEWIKTNIYHDQKLSNEDSSVIDKFTSNFVRKSREKWKENRSNVYYGRSAAVNDWLDKFIPIYRTCNCSDCTNKETEMEVEDVGSDESADQKSEEPNGQSKSSSVSISTF